jgi:hypothetical protein
MEIRANSLRVGNYLRVANPLIDQVKLSGIQWNGEEYTYSYDKDVSCARVEGIPLDRAWFYNCGFLQLNSDDFVIPNLPSSVFRLKENVVSLIVNDLEITEIKYLHELQNIVFVLTGLEIDIE